MAEKEFPPSLKRLQRARKEGKAVKSQLVTLAASLGGMIAVLPITLTWVKNRTLVEWDGSPGLLADALFVRALTASGLGALILLGAASVVVVVVSIAQTGALFAPGTLLPSLARVSPSGLMARIRDGTVNVALGAIRCTILVAAVYPSLRAIVEQGPGIISCLFDEVWLGMWKVPGGSEQVGGWEYSQVLLTSQMWGIIFRILCALIVIGGGAYALARWKFMRQYRMTLQEMRDEHRESEGDPHLKAARRHEHETLMMSDLARRVRKAKVIVVRRMPSVG